MVRIKIIIDTNKIISTALKNGVIRRVFLFENISMYSIDYSLEEIKENISIICKRFSVSLFNKLLKELILPKINIISINEITEYSKEAKHIANNFDIDDWPFIALALKLKLPIWTNDKYMIRYGIESCKYLAIDTEILLKALRREISLNNWKIVKEELKNEYRFN